MADPTAPEAADPGSAAPPPSPSPYRAPAVEVPKGGGAIRGIGEKFTTNAITGTGSMSVPLSTSRGRAGFGPSLSLSYDSGAGNGPFGFGWSLSSPAITRKTDRGLPRYDDAAESDVFLLSGAEDLVPATHPDGTRWSDEVTVPGYRIDRYRPRVDTQFARVERWTDTLSGDQHWRSIARDNVTTVYGRDGGSRITGPDLGGGLRVHSWLISESYDDKGNWIVYSYVAEDGAGVSPTAAAEQGRERAAQRYPRTIRYGNTVPRPADDPAHPGAGAADPAGTGWLFEVLFDYDEGYLTDVASDAGRRVTATGAPTRAWPVRPDPFSVYRSGFEVRTYRRCRRVLMVHHFAELGAEPCVVRATEFDYDDFAPVGPVGPDDERLHPGSSRYGSFMCAVIQSGLVRDDTVAVAGGAVTYRAVALPTVRFGYSRPAIDPTVRVPAAENLPDGIDGSAYRFTDLDGEGVSGVLSDDGGAWWYAPNLGAGRFGALRPVAATPAARLGGGTQLLDLAGDGRLDVVQLGGPVPGYYARTDGAWAAFRPFASRPDLDWDDPNLRFVDLDGDGLADVLVTEDDAVTWCPSLAADGFGPAARVPTPADEATGPRLLLDDGTQSIYLADVTGDGLTDLLRIRNGEISYWPNLGYGRFGARVRCAGAPVFDTLDDFDQRRVRVADLDGSGTADLVYLGRDCPRLYFNQCGNGWSEARPLPPVVPADELPAVQITDLTGMGTACLVWSAPGLGGAGTPLRYLDLMGGQKAHLLVSADNGLGARTEIRYASSAVTYLADKAAGRPWITRLPFPVQVVTDVVTSDQVSGGRFVSSYTYRHGYFDEVEREFRGFALVEQRDAETLQVAAAGDVPSAPPVLTRTWYHTGVFLGRDTVSGFFADVDGPDRYYREPGGDPDALLLPDTVLPPGLTDDEAREACRALRGSMLRQELYAADDSEAAGRPYTVTEQNFTVTMAQPRGTNRHAVFLTTSREKLGYHYDRSLVPVLGGDIVTDATAAGVTWLADPRVEHHLTLAVDGFGNILSEAKICYPRRYRDQRLPSVRDRAEQARIRIASTDNGYTNPVDTPVAYRTPLPAEVRRYEVTGAAAPVVRYTFDDVATMVATAVPLDPEATPTAGVLQKRLIGASRTAYRRDDLTGPSPVGTLEPHALPYDMFTLAFSGGLVTALFAGRATDAELAAIGYVHLDGDDNWWVPSGQVFYSPGGTDPPTVELAAAQAHFYQPRRYRTPMHTAAVSTESTIDYDGYDLLIAQTRDALGSVVTVGERDAADNRTATGLDYRVLAPYLVTDVNRNRTQVAFDALGLVVGTAIMGKPAPAPAQGDSLAGFPADLTDAQVAACFADPVGTAAALLGPATSRMVYDTGAFARTGSAPAAVLTLRRETHASDPVPAGGLKIQIDLLYADGFGRAVQAKKRAEPGPVPTRGPDGTVVTGPDGLPVMSTGDVDPRWTGTGWKVFDNKGRPVRQYEPFFTDTAAFEAGAAIGVTAVACYDPVGRVAATIRPDHSFDKTVFGPWHEEKWDGNDTVLITDPATDPDIGGYVARLDPAVYLPTWYTRASAAGPDDQRAARRAVAHAATPTARHLDPLGRPVLTVTRDVAVFDNPPPGPAVDELHTDRVTLDLDGNQLTVEDAAGRQVVAQQFDLRGKRANAASMEAGQQWSLIDVLDKPCYRWDGPGRRFRVEYDPLRRPTAAYLLDTGAATEITTRLMSYGDTVPDAESSNLRGKAYSISDQAGIVTTDEYDFAGNLLRTTRQVATVYDGTLDWSTAQPTDGSYTTSVAYDALGRPVRKTLPDATVVRIGYNEANLLETLDANLRGETDAQGPVWTPFVVGAAYDAKGQTLRTEHGNAARVDRVYDPLTFRLIGLTTRRDPGAWPGDDPQPPVAGWPGRLVQNLAYSYDPVGNVIGIRDGAQQDVFFRNRRVEPASDYTYDSTYRLIEATGREHLGQVGGAPVAHSYNDVPRIGITPAPTDGNALGAYTERYAYDMVGNLLSLAHRGTDPAAPGWTRSYAYTEASQLEPGRSSNRLTSSSVGGSVETYSTGGDGYDLLGNLLKMPHLHELSWDFDGHLRMTARQAVDVTDTDGTAHAGERTWYTYDADGTRVRKATAASDGTLLDERIYLGDFEVYRRLGGQALTRETVHVTDGAVRVALVETRTAGTEPGIPARLTRYQYGNHLGSVSLELDDGARLVSYEEYTPFGDTAYQAVASAMQVPKRYRHAGRERDDETGLYYHSARYAAPWLGRWISCDPAGLVDGPNLYRYVRDNPMMLTDPKGTDPLPAQPPAASGTTDLGPVRISNVHASLTGAAHATFQLHDLFSDNRSIEIESLSAGGHLHLRSDLALPSFGLNGSGSFDLNLESLRVEHNFASAEIDGRAAVSSGPYRLALDVSAYGSTVLPQRIQLSDAANQLAGSLNEFRGWVGVNGRLEVLGHAVAGFSVSGDLGPGAQGTLDVHGTVGLPSLFGSPQATVLGHLNGSLEFHGGSYTAHGTFHAGVLPIPAYAFGTWDLSSARGLGGSLHYFGPQAGPIGLTVPLNPTGNVTDDTSLTRLQDSMRTPGPSGQINMFEPGFSVGYSYLHLSEGRTTNFAVGFAPHPGLVPYLPGGVSLPLAGPNSGVYVGARGGFTF